MEVTRALMFQMSVAKHFWGDAVLTATYLINRMPSSILKGEIPHRVLFPHHSLYSVPLRIFGCTCYVRDIRPTRTKLDPKSLRCIFLGYSRTQKGYRCFSPDLGRYIVSLDVAFDESSSFFSPVPSQNTSLSGDDFLIYDLIPGSTTTPAPRPLQTYTRGPRQVFGSTPVVATELPPTTSDSSADGSATSAPTTDEELPIALRKGKRQCATYPITAHLSYAGISSSLQAFVSSLASVSVPRSLSEALSTSVWRVAMQEEMSALEDNSTWELVPLPLGKKSIGCRWVYVVKMNPDGTIARHKARLVAKGYAQTYGVDYTDTFSPVAKFTFVRLIISLAAVHDWPLHQLDVKNAFLHGDLQEEVYMEQPPGFVAQGESGLVCRLKKSLYGLKQSPRAWFGRFSEAVLQFGLQRTAKDHSVFFRRSSEGIILLLVYVDDIVITGDDSVGISSLKLFLQKQFHTKDLGLLRYFLGVEVARNAKGIFLSQRKYALDLLTDTGMMDAKPCDTPMTPGVKLSREDGEEFPDSEKYRRIVEKLNYLVVTRPDIAFSVSVVSQFMAAPRTSHWEAVLRILRYVKGTPGKGLLYGKYGHTRIEGFSDADWASSPDDRKSTTGYCVFLGGNLISWKSKKQSVVARSSAESEYRALGHLTGEVTYLQQLLDEIGYETSTPADLWCDNQSAIYISTNPVFHERTKHIEVDCHYIRQVIQQGRVLLRHVKTGEQLADILTKSVLGTRVRYICNKLGMIDIYAPA